MVYKIKVEETLFNTYLVEADSKEEAEELIHDKYYDEGSLNIQEILNTKISCMQENAPAPYGVDFDIASRPNTKIGFSALIPGTTDKFREIAINFAGTLPMRQKEVFAQHCYDFLSCCQNERGTKRLEVEAGFFPEMVGITLPEGFTEDGEVNLEYIEDTYDGPATQNIVDIFNRVMLIDKWKDEPEEIKDDTLEMAISALSGMADEEVIDILGIDDDAYYDMTYEELDAYIYDCLRHSPEIVDMLLGVQEQELE